ncbi:hypothetical protein GCM10012290_17980 [Halolactibacillus alkaliphilus]|uniref:Uncharacterized protein n=1 Tax=Halolactibacillus alkaliphilus TaxID=442899 RepID=A0A511X2I8_9BACI|nr:hypothetical protein HAL01_16170 [Halolactibacillus alkaliphilus]GGN72199.1 hypothetical protein GCM10012290_17980 [Halolactibacillus alkaliphilus]
MHKTHTSKTLNVATCVAPQIGLVNYINQINPQFLYGIEGFLMFFYIMLVVGEKLFKSFRLNNVESENVFLLK